MPDIATLRSAANDDANPLEYDCQDCGIGVICCVWMPQIRERRCLVYSFVVTMLEGERERLREHLSVHGLAPVVNPNA